MTEDQAAGSSAEGAERPNDESAEESRPTGLAGIGQYRMLVAPSLGRSLLALLLTPVATAFEGGQSWCLRR